MNEQFFQLFRIAIVGLCVFVAAFLIIPTVSNISKSTDAKNWTTYSGVVTSAPQSAGGVYSSLYGRSVMQPLEYEYEIHGRLVKANQIGYGITQPPASLKSGDSISVYVNPANENDSVIVVGVIKMHWVKLLIGFAFVVLGKVLWRRM